MEISSDIGNGEQSCKEKHRTTAAMVRPKKKSLGQQKYQFCRQVQAIQVFSRSIMLYDCKTLTWQIETQRRIQEFEIKCFRRLLQIFCKEHKTNEFVRNTVASLVIRTTLSHYIFNAIQTL